MKTGLKWGCDTYQRLQQAVLAAEGRLIEAIPHASCVNPFYVSSVDESAQRQVKGEKDVAKAGKTLREHVETCGECCFE